MIFANYNNIVGGKCGIGKEVGDLKSISDTLSSNKTKDYKRFFKHKSGF
jgi:hypothetical protein